MSYDDAYRAGTSAGRREADSAQAWRAAGMANPAIGTGLLVLVLVAGAVDHLYFSGPPALTGLATGMRQVISVGRFLGPVAAFMLGAAAARGGPRGFQRVFYVFAVACSALTAGMAAYLSGVSSGTITPDGLAWMACGLVSLGWLLAPWAFSEALALGGCLVLACGAAALWTMPVVAWWSLVGTFGAWAAYGVSMSFIARRSRTWLLWLAVIGLTAVAVSGPIFVSAKHATALHPALPAARR